MKQILLEEHPKRNRRTMHFAQYCYLWIDGIRFNLRFNEGRLCVLVIIGATEGRRKELFAVAGSYRESEEP
jgi:putative transposase